MRETVARLVALQAIDDEARGYLLERDDLQDKIQRLKELLDLMTQGLGEKEAKLAEASRWYREKDGELKADQEKVVKAKQKLQTVTKNKEYMAMQKEIENLRKGNLAREEEILKLLEAMEEFRAGIAAEKAKIAELGKEVAKEESNNASRIEELEARITAISSRKVDVLHGLKKRTVSLYDRVRKAREGVAIVPTANGACSGCNFSIPPQQLVKIQLVRTLEQCRNCSRLLYWPEEEEVVDEDAEGAAAPV